MTTIEIRAVHTTTTTITTTKNRETIQARTTTTKAKRNTKRTIKGKSKKILNGSQLRLQQPQQPNGLSNNKNIKSF